MSSADGGVSLWDTLLARVRPLMLEFRYRHMYLKREVKSCDEVGGSCCPLPLPLGTGGGRWTSDITCRGTLLRAMSPGRTFIRQPLCIELFLQILSSPAAS